MIIRPVRHDDLNDLYEIACESGPGFTSLMPDKDRLSRKIEGSIRSFRSQAVDHSEQRYLFVLEEETSGQIMGTTGITSGTGRSQPLYHFRHSTLTHHSRELGLRRSVGALTRCVHYRNCTEFCSLYLRPAFRRANAGKLLSKVRFAFIAQHLDRFPNLAIAQMRGVAGEHGQSPFWDWLRDHFIDLDFSQVTQLAGAGSLDFVEDLMPSLPLYTHLMSNPARAVIGQVHPDTRPALAMLKAEGFRHRGMVDLFDAGPTVECRTDDIRSVREAALMSAEISTTGNQHLTDTGRPVLVTNTGLEDFRAMVVNTDTHALASGRIELSTKQADALGLSVGASIRTLPLGQQAIPAASIHVTDSAEVHYAL